MSCHLFGKRVPVSCMLPFVSLKPRNTQSPSAAPVRRWLVCWLGLILSLSACETQVPKPNLPPSESDLVLLKPIIMCFYSHSATTWRKS